MNKNSVQTQIVSLFKSYFGINDIDVNTNFFDLGLNSFELTNLQNKLNAALQTEIPIIIFYEFPTIALLAEHLQAENENEIN